MKALVLSLFIAFSGSFAAACTVAGKATKSPFNGAGSLTPSKKFQMNQSVVRTGNSGNAGSLR